MKKSPDIFFKIRDELDALSTPLTEAISLLGWALAEIGSDHPEFSSVKMIQSQLDKTLNSIGDMYQYTWLILSYDRLKSRVY